ACQPVWALRLTSGPTILPGGRMMTSRLAPKVMASQLVRVLRPQHPDYHYLKKVFQYTREFLQVGPAPSPKRLPAFLTEAEVVAFYEAVWTVQHLTHVIMLKLLLVTGVRNAELVHLRLTDVDLQAGHVRIVQGKGHKDREGLFPRSLRGELAQYVDRQRGQGATYLFESRRHRPYSTRRLRQLVAQYGRAAGIEKRVYPHCTCSHDTGHMWEASSPHLLQSLQVEENER